jgi:hypothetical protein
MRARTGGTRAAALFAEPTLPLSFAGSNLKRPAERTYTGRE